MPKLKYDMGFLWEQHKELAKQNEVPFKTFCNRIYKGYTPEEAANTFYHMKRERLYETT